VASSHEYYEMASREFDKWPVLGGDIVRDYIFLTHGLVLFGKDQHEEAFTVFSDVIQAVTDRSAQMIQSSSSSSSLSQSSPSTVFLDGPNDSGTVQWTDILDVEDSLMAVAVNNLAICAIYLRRVAEAASRLEALIHKDPSKFLTDPIVFNLCTLYDLTCAPELSTNKKKVLHRVAGVYNIEEPLLHWKSFRLT
jgi:hypothetical protein